MVVLAIRESADQATFRSDTLMKMRFIRRVHPLILIAAVIALGVILWCPEGFVDPAKVVERKPARDSSPVVLPLLAKGVREPSESPVAHARAQVAALENRRNNLNADFFRQRTVLVLLRKGFPSTEKDKAG